MTTVLIILIVSFLVYQVSKSSVPNKTVNKSCNYHQWEYRKQPDTPDEYLMCKNCEKTPTQLVEEQS